MHAELTPDVAASVAASYAAGAGSLHASQLSQLAAWAVDKLAVVQSMDPAAYDSLRTSVDGVMANLQAVVADAGPASPATPHLPTWTNALVLGVQQLVTTLRAPGTGGASIEAMLAAQEAMQAALVSAAGAARAVASGSAAGELPAGLNGLLQFALAIIAMVIAAVPKGGAAAAGQGGGDQVPLRYDVPALHAYFSRRPMLVLRRNTEVVSRLSSFCIAILTDWRTGQWDARIHERAIWARKVRLGWWPLTRLRCSGRCARSVTHATCFACVCACTSTADRRGPGPHVHQDCAGGGHPRGRHAKSVH